MTKRDYINLYSKDLSTKKWPSDRNFLITFWGSAIIIFFFLIYYGVSLTSYFQEYKKNKELSAEYKELSLKDKELLALSVKLKELNIKSNALNKTIFNLNKLFQKKIKWSKFLEIFSGYLNDNVWANSMSVDLLGKDNRFLYVQVQGGAISLKDLNDFVSNVEKDNKNVKVSFKVIDKNGVMFYSFGINFTFDTEKLK
ncbi:hypothetical protein TTHT_1331 [Thermotomaculum hydrothermale]|uniref:Fimbrial assembly family protein n=1 Tax=Thermotomaculum hydrothermale TaxID=981385 RepID=A0A7R6SYN5_9BACT|nr:hypothetical protein [Thermotomaculum hydrothermale]BBB32845.1 hypothetical protein TTHT_1331 [Thermotomaculum hydrothermale]